jgi:hypothetical protein
MLACYLALNGVLYVVLAVWCSVAPVTTAAFLGLAWSNAGGAMEYLAVYGGLQGGLGVFFLLSLWQADLRRAALWLCCCAYAGLVVLRTLAALSQGFDTMGNAVAPYVLESVLLVWALVLMRRANCDQAG